MAEAFEVVGPGGRDRVVFNRARLGGLTLGRRKITGRAAWLPGKTCLIVP